MEIDRGQLIAEVRKEIDDCNKRIDALGDAFRKATVDTHKTQLDKSIIDALIAEKSALCDVRNQLILGALTVAPPNPAGYVNAVEAEVGRGGAALYRRSEIDVSSDYASLLITTAPAHLRDISDFRAELAKPLPGPILLRDSGVLMQRGSMLLPFKLAEDQVMSDIELLFARAFHYSVRGGGTEEVWASTADLLTGNVWSALDDLTGALRMASHRKPRDVSGATDSDTKLRPDYWLTVRNALLLKAEHRRTPEELGAAKRALVDKMRGWNPVALRGLPFIPCFAVGGALLQFCAIHRGSDGACTLADVSDVFNMTVPLQRLGIVRASFNMFRIFIKLRSMMPEVVPVLYTKQVRAHGCSITVMDDHVRKVCLPASDRIYACLQGTSRIPSSISVTKVRTERASGFSVLHITPVCVELKPDTEDDLKSAICAVLSALTSFHALGFVHRDVRWPNVLRDADDRWLLSDFELAAPAGTPLPEPYRESEHFAPEVRRCDPVVSSADIWQVGMLVKNWERVSASRELSEGAAAFFELLTTADPHARPGAADARKHSWLN